ncbi:hypothetical protein GCM10022243_03400 [Saccharothrix violaceirubra]|uniref:Uncharacterized protein n=1 Tax=Saccharothrix violaceirubra TaxID=413306 RepID=A0A7W7T006_9PSEU|nr:hypothetical protein [Saccharothrix violaceirubra]MBB4964088.1 hypothetical protein [Saccharothrix violaceirubra]
MITNPESVKARRRLTERIACTVVFTVIQLWSTVVIVTRFEADGVVSLAVALVLAGGLFAVLDAWREVRAERRELNAEIREPLVHL